MMIEIIKHGSTYKKIKCKECGCEFAFTDKDCYKKTSSTMGLDIWYVDCPECGMSLNRPKALKDGVE